MLYFYIYNIDDMTSLTIALENSQGGCGWVKITESNLTRTRIEDLVDVVSEYGTHVNDFLMGETTFPVFSEFLQDRRLGNGVQPDLNLKDFSDNDVQNIFCNFFKKNDGPVRLFIFVGKDERVEVSFEGSVERIEHAIRMTQ